MSGLTSDPYHFSFRFRIAYREVSTKRAATRLRPLITAKLTHGEDEYLLPMLVDTGADNVVLPYKAMELLGVEQSQCKYIRGNTIRGVQEGYEGPKMRLSLPDILPAMNIECAISFAPILDNYPYGLLGREPILNHLRYCFTHSPEHAFYVGHCSSVGAS